MMQEWFAFCAKKGVTFNVAQRGIEILMEREPDGSRPNMMYYQDKGWPALLAAVEAETAPPRKQREKVVRV